MKLTLYPTLCLFFLLRIWNDGIVLSLELHFDSGVLYEYEYSTSVSVAPVSVDLKDVPDITTEAKIYVHSLWRNPTRQLEQLLHIRIQDLKLMTNSSETTNKPVVVDKHIKEPFLVHIQSGKIQGVFDISLENTASLNFKKGLASLLQIQASSGVMIENDTTGQCRVSYYTKKDDIYKVKDLITCQRNINYDTWFSKQIFGMSSNGSSETDFTMNDGHIKTVKSKELHSLVLEEQPNIGIHVSARQVLKLLSSLPGTDNEAYGEVQEVLSSLKSSYVNHTIHAVPVVGKDHNHYSVSKLLNNLKAPETHKSHSAATKVFLHLSEFLQNLNMTEIRSILKNNAKFVTILTDAIAAASTPDSLNAFISSVNIKNPKMSTLLKKFLYACAFSSQPSTHLINAISHILSKTSTQWETHEVALIVLGTAIKKMCAANMCHVQEVENAKKRIIEGLHASSEEKEIKSYLLALKSASLPETLPIMLQYINQTKSLSGIVLSALHDIPSEYITEKVKEHLRDIFIQKHRIYAASVRLDAAQLLLMHDPLHTDVREMILKIAEEKPEVSKFLMNKIRNILHSVYPARNVILGVLKDPKLNNYFHLARVGYSSSYAGLMTEKKNVVPSYDFDFLFSESGMLKQSNSHIYTQSKGRRLHLLQASLQTTGLDSLMGSEPAKGEEEEEFMAGMSAMFLGVHMQPIVFFQGYADLMSKYFSSDEGPMKILSGNILVLNHRQTIILQSGLQIQGFFHGGLSLDVSADVAFSLFSQESKTSVNTKFSLVVSSRAEIDSPLMNIKAETLAEVDSLIRVDTTVNFSKMPVQYCLQLIRDPLLYRVSMTTKVPDQYKWKTVQRKKQKWIIPGEETALHKDNSNMCNNLLNQSSN